MSESDVEKFKEELAKNGLRLVMTPQTDKKYRNFNQILAEDICKTFKIPLELIQGIVIPEDTDDE